MKKILYIVGLATMILFNATAVSASNDIYYINENNIEMTEQEYNNLLSIGFTKRQISWMDEEIFLQNKDIEATLVAHEKRIVKTTTVIRNGITKHINKILTEEELEEEMMRSQQQPSHTNIYGNFYDGMSYDSVKEMDLSIAIYEDPYEGDFAIYKLDMYWDVMPDYRYYDAAGIYFDGVQTQRSSVIAHRQYYITTGGNHGTTQTCAEDTTSNSAVTVFQLPSGSLELLESYMYFTVNKLPNVGTITALYVTGDYAHGGLYSSYDAINYASMESTGLWFSYPYVAAFDNMSTATAGFFGEW